jgi:hypothetical protein
VNSSLTLRLSARLCAAQVVGVRRPPAANQTSLLGDRFDVIAVAHPTRFGQPKYGLAIR